MNKKLGIIIGIIVAVAAIVLGVVFLAPDKDTGPENPSESISQNENVNKEEISEKVEDIDLNTVDLSEYGISANHKINEAYPTEKGIVYCVYDYDKGTEDEFEAFLFLTVGDKVMCDSIGLFQSESFVFLIEYAFYDINNDDVEELIIHIKNHVNDYYVFTFNGDEMSYLGRIFNNFGSLYGGDSTVTTVSRECSNDPESESYVVCLTYKISNGKIVEVDRTTCAPFDNEKDTQFGDKIIFTAWDSE